MSACCTPTNPGCPDCQDAVYAAVAQSPALQRLADDVFDRMTGGWRPSATTRPPIPMPDPQPLPGVVEREAS